VLTEPRRWEDFDPSWRFVRACVAAQKTGAFVVPSSHHEEYREAASTICHAAGLDDFHAYRPNLDQGQTFDWKAASAITLDNPDLEQGGVIAAPAGLSYYDYVLWSSQRMWDLRQSYSPLVINSSWELARARKDAIPYALGDQGLTWFDPPLQAHGDRFRFVGGIHQPLGMWIAGSSITSAALHDLMLEVGPLELSWLPPWLRDPHAPAIDEALNTLLLM
jgi:hypothetical protein